LHSFFNFDARSLNNLPKLTLLIGGSVMVLNTNATNLDTNLNLQVLNNGQTLDTQNQQITNRSSQAPITYLESGDSGAFGAKDQMVIAWQTSEAQPQADAYKVEFSTNDQVGGSVTPVGRVVDNYLAADPSLPVPPTATGPRTNYYAVLGNLDYDTDYSYRVVGPGLPAAGFEATFHTRKQSPQFSYQVMGDEGFFPADPTNKPYLANYEARVVNTMYNIQNLSIPGIDALPKPDLGLNTGDNVYLKGSEANYGDFWMPVWNNDTASNETGAPYVRNIPYYIVAGNHDFGGSGDRVNLLADDTAARYSGNLGGGDALQYFNNYYFPLNGPTGVDPQYIYNGDTKADNGFYLSYQGKTYDSPAAIESFRNSTTVDTGQGTKRQIDYMSNYSFDNGNAHFTFLDANPHLFDAINSYDPIYQSAPSDFPNYPSPLRDWLVNDLDSSKQTWKVVVFHQPAFSSGDATLRNDQMRRIASFLEDHGVNVVYNGHEHNYQRTLPIRALNRVADTPTTQADPAVAVDTNYDGINNTVPDGVLYIVEGAGGDRDFDNNLTEPRGSGPSADQDDSATGTYTYGPGLTFPNGPASWLDTNLTTAQMSPFFPNAGEGQKITAHFKSKVFSFGDVVIDGNTLTQYQITEPLQDKSSATAVNPFPYGTDVNGNPLNDPIPETLIDPATGSVVTPPAQGTPALLDKFTITKPDVSDGVSAQFSAPSSIHNNDLLDYEVNVTNNSPYALNGTQVVVTLPEGVNFAGDYGSSLTQHGHDVVLTLGRLDLGEQRTVHLTTQISTHVLPGTELASSAVVRSSTALPVSANCVTTEVVD